MKYIKFTDWQELGLKKDVDDIRRTIKSNKSLISTTCVETIVAIISLMLSFSVMTMRKKLFFLIYQSSFIGYTDFFGFMVFSKLGKRYV